MKRVELKKVRRAARGEALIECAMAGGLMVILGLFFLDAFVLCVAHTTLDRITFAAAKAASIVDQNQARQAANWVVQQAAAVRKPVIRDISVSDLQYVGNQRVEVTTKMTMVLPANVPGLPRELRFIARSIQPVVAAPEVKYQ